LLRNGFYGHRIASCPTFIKRVHLNGHRPFNSISPFEFFIIPVDLSSCFISSSPAQRIPAGHAEARPGTRVLRRGLGRVAWRSGPRAHPARPALSDPPGHAPATTEPGMTGGNAWHHARNSRVSRSIKRRRLRRRTIYPERAGYHSHACHQLKHRRGPNAALETLTASAALPAGLRRSFRAKMKLSEWTRATHAQTSPAARCSRAPSRAPAASPPQLPSRLQAAPDPPRPGTPGRFSSRPPSARTEKAGPRRPAQRPRRGPGVRRALPQPPHRAAAPSARPPPAPFGVPLPLTRTVPDTARCPAAPHPDRP